MSVIFWGEIKSLQMQLGYDEAVWVGPNPIFLVKLWEEEIETQMGNAR